MNNKMDEIIRLPADRARIIHRVKDSKFYGNIAPVFTEEEAKSFIQEIKNEFDDATHNVNVYRVIEDNEVKKRADDDGEPAGSSAPPILRIIEGRDLCNAVIVVTRYFGGTKLGIGGLVRAYGDTARLVIEAAGVKESRPIWELQVTGAYNHLGTIMGQIESFEGKIKKTKYDNDGGTITFWLKPGYLENLKSELKTRTGNKFSLCIIGKYYS